ncbi:Bifunctional adenosylcobalamin biosynthesis protein CobU [subsurface metagenome]
MGLVPKNRLGRLYRDLLGKVNQELARHADKIHLMVAGIAIDVKNLGRS